MIAVAAVVLSIGALAVRTVGPFGWAVAAGGGIAVFVVPLVRRTEIGRAQWLLATSAGMAAVLVVRFAAPLPLPTTRWGIAAAVVAGIAEEVIFRRGLYGLLERWGAGVAVVVSALAFALVHVPVYGWRVLGIDIAAGIVFGWQRWVAGHWSSPAATHALANVLGHV